MRAENPVADPRHRGRNYQLPDQIGPLARDGLGDATADVITGEHRPVESQLLDQRDDAARLCGRGVPADRLRRVAVRLAEPPEIRHDDLRHPADLRPDRSVIGPVARPPVKQQNGGAPARPVVGEAEAVHGIAAMHNAEYLPVHRTQAGSTLRSPAAADAGGNWTEAAADGG